MLPRNCPGLETLITKWIAMEHAFDKLPESPLKLVGATISVATIGYVLVQGLRKLSDKRNQLPPPPGPPRHFFIGNLLQFPKNPFYKRFWEIVSVDVPGTSMVILNSYDIAQELLNKRPNSTARRNIGYMMLEVYNGDQMEHLPGSLHSERRKMLRRGIGPQRVGSHDYVVEKHVNRLIVKLQSVQGDPNPVVSRAVGDIVIEVTYGTKLATIMNKELSSWNIENLGASHLYSLQLLVFHYVPSWMPGARFKRLGARSHELSTQIRHIPYEKATALHESGELGHSLATDLLDEFGPKDNVMDALATLYMAGADTTSAAIMVFINALLFFPDVSKRVYEEVNRVKDGTRLPSVSDRPNLPYTEAVWKEAFRWNTFIPLGVPHVNSEDEVINGYLIKSGTVIHQNNGFMFSDPNVWGDPEAFRPERFLTDEANSLPNPLVLIFGYGMRVCPGMYLADRTGFHMGATIAALYDVAPLEGKSRPRPESAGYTDSFIRARIGFEGRFIPRDSRALALLRDAKLEA
ncbi:hypothetical protein M408DRAFT_23708 [Serendipita vermifera MAFF 305830]|uniref:Cytochrome P450 n=1 Tax=Serendipita vermifera MAFF 305830 TaxID=933852 RepID=A0A0C2WQ23_SERVB|nr:hypothetical protein M408DRAFT_23708 [Serendipita vermifera MAFF 305830]